MQYDTSTAHKAIDRARDALYTVSDKAFEASRALAKRAKIYYPKFRASLPSTGDVQRQLVHTRDWAFGARRHSGHYLATAQTWSIRLALGYLAVKLFKARNVELGQIDNAVRTHIHEKPVESAIIALGVGYVLGRFLRL